MASELIKQIQTKIDEVGDQHIYVISPVEEDCVCGFEISSVGIDADDSIVVGAF
jgi:hypothetical protein